MMSLRTEGSATRTGIFVPSMNWRGPESQRSRLSSDQTISDWRSASEYAYPGDDPAVRPNTPPSMGPTELTWRLWQAAQWSAKSCCPRAGSGTDEAARRGNALAFSGASERKKGMRREDDVIWG